MNNFDVVNLTDDVIEELERLKNFIEFSVKYLKLSNTVFNIIFVSEEEIQKLNREYRNIDRVTDVISFALEDDKSFINTDFRVLGDIYICLSKAHLQSVEYNHSFFREICFLSIHGLLHLLGYDHMKIEDEKIMFRLQEEILDEYGIKR